MSPYSVKIKEIGRETLRSGGEGSVLDTPAAIA